MRYFLCSVLFIAFVSRAIAAEYGSFSTSGHAKSQGVSISFDYPLAWKPSENPKSGIVHEFRDPKTGGRDALIIVVPTTQPKKSTPQSFRASFELPEAQEKIMPGAKHLKKEFVEGLNYPCVALDYDLMIPQLAPSVVQVRNYILIVEGKMIQIQFYAVAAPTVDVRAERADMMMHVIQSTRPVKN